MRVVLDTNVLWDKAAMARLRSHDGPRILPVVAFAERARQFRARGWSLEEFWAVLQAAGIEVEAMGPAQAVLRSMDLADDRAWQRLARDAFIAGHVGPNDQLWTRDVEDYVRLGVPAEQIVAI